MSTINERVERGAALLDAKRPGWWRDVDLNALNIRSACNCVGSPCNCVNGQLGGGSFTAMAIALGLLSWLQQVACGFGADEPDGLSDDEVERILDLEYEALTEAWRELITRRRELAGAST